MVIKDAPKSAAFIARAIAMQPMTARVIDTGLRKPHRFSGACSPMLAALVPNGST